MYVRRSTPTDTEAVHALTGAALARILTQVRATDDWLPAPIPSSRSTPTGGSSATWPARGATPAPTPRWHSSPPAVHPDHQGHGIGTALLHTVLGAADALGEPMAAITGIPTGYYARFGFRPSQEHAITLPSPTGNRTSRSGRSAPTPPPCTAGLPIPSHSPGHSKPTARGPGPLTHAGSRPRSMRSNPRSRSNPSSNSASGRPARRRSRRRRPARRGGLGAAGRGPMARSLRPDPSPPRRAKSPARTG
jgi:putative acetyltransferase